MDRVERVRAPDDPLPACDERIAVLHRGWRSIAPLRRIAYAALIALGVASPVEAGPIYYAFDFSGDGVVGSGTLITSGSTDPSAPFAGADDILSVSGTVNGEAITGLLGTIGPAAYSPDGYFIYDNDFYAAGSASAVGGYFDDDGLLFTTSAGTYNLFFDGSSYWDWTDQGSGITVAFSAVDPPPPVQEPSSALVLAPALVGLLLLSRRRARRGRRRYPPSTSSPTSRSPIAR